MLRRLDDRCGATAATTAGYHRHHSRLRSHGHTASTENLGASPSLPRVRCLRTIPPLTLSVICAACHHPHAAGAAIALLSFEPSGKDVMIYPKGHPIRTYLDLAHSPQVRSRVTHRVWPPPPASRASHI